MDDLIKKGIFELYAFLQNDDPTSFKAHLFRLIAKSDGDNRQRIGMVYPLEVTVWTAWQDSEDPVAYFTQAGIEADRSVAMGVG